MCPFYKLLIWLVLLVGPAACGTFEVGIEPTPAAQITRASVQITSAVTISPISTPTFRPADTPVMPSPVPQVNTLYLGTLSGRYATFVRNTNDQQRFSYDSYLGFVIDENDRGEELLDFRKLERPRQILSSNLELQIYGLKVDKTDRLLYASLFQRSSPTEYQYIERIVEINPDDLTNRDVWTMEIGSNKYPGFPGGAYIEQVAGHFIVLRLSECFGCKPGPLQPILVLNAKTGREKFLGAVGDVMLDLWVKTVLYRNLESFREMCEPGTGCDNEGYRTVNIPAGEVITEPLP